MTLGPAAGSSSQRSVPVPGGQSQGRIVRRDELDEVWLKGGGVSDVLQHSRAVRVSGNRLAEGPGLTDWNPLTLRATPASGTPFWSVTRMFMVASLSMISWTTVKGVPLATTTPSSGRCCYSPKVMLRRSNHHSGRR